MIAKHKRVQLKKILAVLVCLYLGVCIPGTAFAAEESGTNSGDLKGILEQQAQNGQIEKIRDQLQKVSENGLTEMIPDFNAEKIMDSAVSGSMKFSFPGLVNKAASFLFKEVFVNLHILIKLIIIVIICSMLKNLQASFLNQSVGEVAFFACYIVVVSIMVVSLNVVLTLGREIIDSMVTFMHATIPALITLLVSGGNFTSAGVFQPMLVMIVEVCATIMKNGFLPLVTLSVIVSIVDNISDKIQISRLAAFFKQICTWGLGLMLTVFVGILAIQGSLGAVVDGVTSKTAKFAIGAFIPVVGKYLADAADAVIGCSLLIKNAAGVAAMIGIIGICIVPLLKIFALILLYRITCIFIEPIADKRITNCINDMANALTYILGVSAAVALMFLVSVTAIIGASNIASMMR